MLAAVAGRQTQFTSTSLERDGAVFLAYMSFGATFGIRAFSETLNLEADQNLAYVPAAIGRSKTCIFE